METIETASLDTMGQRIRALRKANGLTMNQLAELVDAAQSTISRMKLPPALMALAPTLSSPFANSSDALWIGWFQGGGRTRFAARLLMVSWGLPTQRHRTNAGI